jgi:hypothetical protein
MHNRLNTNIFDRNTNLAVQNILIRPVDIEVHFSKLRRKMSFGQMPVVLDRKAAIPFVAVNKDRPYFVPNASATGTIVTMIDDAWAGQIEAGRMFREKIARAVAFASICPHLTASNNRTGFGR